MQGRVHVLMGRAEKERFRKLAADQGKSLSEWLREAAMEKAAAGLGLAPWPVESQDIELARSLVERHAGLGARDLLHVACCARREVTRVRTFDRALAAAFP